MITGTFTSADNKYLFREKSSQYWISTIFSPVAFSLPENISKKSRFIIVFNIDKFMQISRRGIEEIINFIKSLKPDNTSIHTIKNLPFWIINSAIFEKKYLEEKQLGGLKYFDLLSDYKILKAGDNQRQIQDAVTDFQIGHYTKRGVIIKDYANFFIEGLSPVGSGSIVSSGVTIRGESHIGNNVTLFPNVYIENSFIGDSCTILPGCIIRDSKIENNVTAGPYSHLRNNALVKQNAKIGNFVEMKKSTLSEGSKAMHLSYIGDCTAGRKVNFGAGTITCNYDGEKKSQTIIKDDVFIGSGTELIAPLTIGRNSYIGAGSTITKDVPPGTLAIGRGKQRNIPGWVQRKKTKKK